MHVQQYLKGVARPDLRHVIRTGCGEGRLNSGEWFICPGVLKKGYKNRDTFALVETYG